MKCKTARVDVVPAIAVGAKAVGTVALGTIALGAVALGACAIGALAIGRLGIGRARIRRLEIDELVVGRLRVPGKLMLPIESPGGMESEDFQEQPRRGQVVLHHSDTSRAPVQPPDATGIPTT